MKHLVKFALPAVALALTACGKPSDIECPTVQLRSADGVLVDTKADIEAYGVLFQAGYEGNTIPDAVAAVRQKYPGATTEEIRNFLIAAYCPIARQDAVGASAQKAKLQQFEGVLATNLATDLVE